MEDLTNLGSDIENTEIAILLDDAVNKYHPGIQVFRLQSINGTQENDTGIETVTINKSRFMNMDMDIGIDKAQLTAVVKLELPREVTRNYPLKYIPPGTRFIVSFNSGDITKPVIVGREYN